MSESPADLGYRMPAEWEEHTQTWMGWPDRPDNWRDDARHAQLAFAAVAEAVSKFEPVKVCANSSQVAAARKLLPGHVSVVEVAQDDAWFRDTGPTFVIRDRESGSRCIAGVDWKFNAWGGLDGGLYPSWEKDQQVAGCILQMEKCRRFECPIVMEGGSIHVDGEGTLLTTEECLLNPNRNPHLSKDQIQDWLRRMLGVQKVLWLPRGLFADDDTNGHIDNFACFARPGLVLLAWTEDESDPQHAISSEALNILSGSTDAKGRKLTVVKVPLPTPLHCSKEEAAGVQAGNGVQPRTAGTRLAASYINFYVCNGGVIMPGFGVPDEDERAKRVIREAFPGRSVVVVPTREILLGGGNIHCITQQQPLA